jgi:SAM-dependent methyltransferase
VVTQAPAVNQPEYWRHRLERYGHTGDSNAVIYAYDQPQRLAAVASVIQRESRRREPFRHALDLGCGTGDFSRLLLDAGVKRVSAVDVSPAVVEFVRDRFRATGDRFDASCAAIQDAAHASGSFDLMVCVNALQHVLDRSDFERAVANMCRMAAPGALVVTCDYSTTASRDLPANEYVVVRARQSYIDAFVRGGCTVRGVFGLPRIGVRACGLVTRIGLSLMGGGRSSGAETTAAAPGPESRSKHVQQVAHRAILTCAGPVDRLLFPFPAALTDMAVLVFEKV